MVNRDLADEENCLKHERRITLNGTKMTTRESAHAHLKERLRLPDWYGNNLDALNDCLGEIGRQTHIIIQFSPKMQQALGDYGDRLINVFNHAAEQNPNLRISVRTWF